jgi:hypothetical protein
MNPDDRNDSKLITREVFPAIAEERRSRVEDAVARLLDFQRRLGKGLLIGTIVAVVATVALVLWKTAT